MVAALIPSAPWLDTGVEVQELNAAESAAAMLDHFNEAAFAPTQPMALTLVARAQDAEEAEVRRWANVLGRFGMRGRA